MTDALPHRWPDEAEQRHIHPVLRFFGRITSPRMLRDPERLAGAVRGKIVVITGASSGLGASLARHCGRAGATVVICARSTDKLNEVAERIEAEGGRAAAYPVDLTDDAQVRQFAADILRDHGHVDVLVHNAGKSLNRSIHLSYRRPKDLHATTGANYLGPARLTLSLLPYMRARGSGHILNIATAGLLLYPAPGWSFYLASKAAFDWWLRSVAMEARADGVATTHYYLGSVRTRMSAPDKLLHTLPSQSADDAAWGVARALVKQPRVVAWRPLFLFDVAAAALRGPLDLVGEKVHRRLVRDTHTSLRHAIPQEGYVSASPLDADGTNESATALESDPRRD